MNIRQQRLIDANALTAELEALRNGKKKRGYGGGWNDAINAAIGIVEDAETLGTEYIPEEEQGYEYAPEYD